mgnify:CR=1 FL=1
MTTGATGTSLIAFLSQRLTRFLDDAFPPSTSAACDDGAVFLECGAFRS